VTAPVASRTEVVIAEIVGIACSVVEIQGSSTVIMNVVSANFVVADVIAPFKVTV
jgi:hypothetical protein